MTQYKQHKRHGFGELLVREVEVSSAQLLASNTTPVEMIPAPGPGKMLMLVAGVIQIHGGTTDYQTDGDLTINYKAAGTGAAVTSSLDDVINDGTAGSVSIFGAITEAENNAVADIENQPLHLISTVNPTAGDRLLKVHLLYTILPCSAV